MADYQLSLIENYIYLHHTDTFILIPTYPEQIQDNLPITFSQSTPMSRTAPIYSYSNAGPRSMNVQLSLHRDLMTAFNKGVSNLKVEAGDDYIDTLLKQVQAMALPAFNSSQKMVDPPIISCKFGTDIYITGVVTGSVSVSYGLPILRNGKYGSCSIGFNVSEIEPYGAREVMEMGSYRGLNRTLERSWSLTHGGGGGTF